MPRSTPYTATGIKRKHCVRCGERAHAQWNVCALGRQYLPICKECDLGLNRLAVEFMAIPNIDKVMRDYERKLADA